MSHADTIPQVRRLVDFGLLEQAPRAIMTNVEVQVFPLFADRRRLQHFVDRHLNDVLSTCAMRFDVVTPMVLFAVLYYPTMHGYDRAEASVLAQDEYYFLVPVRCVRRVDGREIVTKGVVTPYIYVNNAISTPVGRELYGWQKAIYRISPVAPRGARLREHEPYLQVERPVPGRDGESMEFRMVLELRYRTDASPIRLGGPPSRLLEVVDELPAMGALAFRTLLGEVGSVGGLAEFPTQMADVFGLLRDVLHPDEDLGVFSLVQFPHPSLGETTPSGNVRLAAAYQALTRTELRVRNIRELALLGSSPAGILDPSRGFSLRMMGHGVDQAVTRLGLQVSATEEDEHGHELQILHPVFPVRAQFDLEVAALETVARRTARSDWIDDRDNLIAPRAPGTASAYNTFLGPSSAEGFTSYGRLRQEQEYRLFGMRVPFAPLERLCHEIAPFPPGMSIRPRPIDGDGVVVMVLTRLAPARDPHDRLEWFSGLYLNIGVIADLEFEGRSKLVFLETHGFTDNPHAFVVGRELLAANRWLMAVDESPQPWIAAKPEDGRHMLSVATETLRTINAGDRVGVRPLLDIVERDDDIENPQDKGVFAPHIAEVFGDQRFAYVRVDSIPRAGADNRLTTAVVRCNVELVYFSRLDDVVPEPPELGDHDIFIYPYESIPLVRDFRLRVVDRPAPRFVRPGSPMPQCVPCDLALGGRFPAAHRGLLTLYEWADGKWSFDMLDEFFGAPESDPFRPEELP